MKLSTVMISKFKVAFIAVICGANSTFAVNIDPDVNGYIQDIGEFKPSLQISTEYEIQNISIPKKIISLRTKNYQEDPRIESFKIFLKDPKADISLKAKKYAKTGKEHILRKLIVESLPKAQKNEEGIWYVEVNSEMLKVLDSKKYFGKFSRKHYKVTLVSEQMTPTSKKELLAQVKPYLTGPKLKSLGWSLRRGEKISVDRDLLPKFAKNLVKKYISFRGPNCFHSALAFQGSQMPRSVLVNVKKEQGYHRAMINYDELWRSLSTQFYEVLPERSTLKYGDILVFFDVDSEIPRLVNFRTIRHAAVYLFDQYTFSKGSKSPNTPYSVKTLEDEWNTWKKITKKLRLKVFRRSYKKADKNKLLSLTDWLY